MNGDTTCTECGKDVPRAAEYGHMLAVHGWDRERYYSERSVQFAERKENLPFAEKAFEGYRPFLYQDKRKVSRRMTVILGTIVIAASLYSPTATAVALAIVMGLLFSGLRGQEAVDDSLNGMIEQLRERIMDLEAAAEQANGSRP